jgi:hypothetical protein
MMSTTASLPSVVKPRFIEPVGESQTSEGDACYLRDTPDNGARNIAGVSLIRLKRIYNFLCSMLILHHLLRVLFTLRGVFM